MFRNSGGINIDRSVHFLCRSLSKICHFMTYEFTVLQVTNVEVSLDEKLSASVEKWLEGLGDRKMHMFFLKLINATDVIYMILYMTTFMTKLHKGDVCRIM